MGPPVTWKQHVAPVGGTSAVTTGSWTPTAAGNQAVGFGFDGAASAFTGITGTGTYVAPNTILVPAPNTGYKVATNMSLTAGAQTTTFTDSGANQVIGFLEEYANVDSVMFQQSASIAAPGNNVIFGPVSMAVPAGGKVVTVCIDFSGSGADVITVCNGRVIQTGTNLTGGYAWAISEISGPAYATPQFKSLTGGGDTFKIMYAILLPAGVLQPMSAVRSTENNSPWSIVIPTHVKVGDVIMCNYGGLQGGSGMLPISASDGVNTVNGGAYTSVNPHWDPISTFGNQGLLMIANVDAPGGLTISLSAATGAGTAGGFCGALHVTGFQGLPVIDIGANTYLKDTTGASTTQIGTGLAMLSNTILLASPWNSTTVGPVNNWISMNGGGPGPGNTDSMFWSYFYEPHGFNNFSGTLAASNWTTQMFGVRDSGSAPLLGQILT